MVDRQSDIEVYPAATLLALGIDPRGYKQDGNHRRRILRQLSDVYLEDEEDATACIDNDDGLDAVICAPTAASTLLAASSGRRMTTSSGERAGYSLFTGEKRTVARGCPHLRSESSFGLQRLRIFKGENGRGWCS